MSQSSSDTLRERIIQTFGNRCAYCLSAQKYVLGVLEIDHIRPTSLGGSDNETNLCLACRLCNNYKSNQTSAIDPESSETVELFNPRIQKWSEHFKWSEDGIQILGLTSCGRATVIALKLNNIIAVTVRKNWVEAGWHPPNL